MAKFHGIIGYIVQVETAPGVWTDQTTERTYRGDILSNVNRWKDGENLNPNVTIDNKLSILSDPYAYKNLSQIRYVNWMGTNWTVTKIEVQRPRLILTVGGVYNGPTS
jgi:hypothetical protein